MDKYTRKRLTSKEDLVNNFDSILSLFCDEMHPLDKVLALRRITPT
jgi:hypothetical protein